MQRVDEIENLLNNGTKHLLIIDDSCEETSNSKQFVRIASTGSNKGTNTIYIKQNLFHQSKLRRDVLLHQSKLGRDAELQSTHIVLFNLPIDALQINILSQQLGLGSQFKEWYQEATPVAYGRLLIDSTPKTVDSLSYCAKNGSDLTKFYLPARIETKLSGDE